MGESYLQRRNTHAVQIEDDLILMYGASLSMVGNMLLVQLKDGTHQVIQTNERNER